MTSSRGDVKLFELRMLSPSHAICCGVRGVLSTDSVTLHFYGAIGGFHFVSPHCFCLLYHPAPFVAYRLTRL